MIDFTYFYRFLSSFTESYLVLPSFHRDSSGSSCLLLASTAESAIGNRAKIERNQSKSIDSMSKRPKATGHRSRDSPPISRAGRSGFTGLFFLFLFFSFFFFFFRFFSFDFLLVSFGCFFVCCSSIFLFFFFLRVDPTRETRWRFSLDWFYRVCLFFFYLVFSFFHFFLYCQGSCRLSSRFRLGLVVVVVVFFVIWNGPLMRSRLLLSTMKNAARGKKKQTKQTTTKPKKT